MTVIPALMDAHTHLSGSSNPDEDDLGRGFATNFDFAAGCDRCLRWGVTTVCSGGELQDELGRYRDKVAAGEITMTPCVEKHPLAAGAIVLGIGTFGFCANLFFANSTIGLMAAGACIGAYTAITNVLCPILTRRFFGSRDYGTIYSRIGIVMSFSSMLQAPILGTVLDMAGWEALELTMAGLLVVCIALLTVTVKVGDKMVAKESYGK